MSYLTRGFACSYCGNVIESTMTEVYHIEDGKEIFDGVVHKACFELFVKEKGDASCGM